MRSEELRKALLSEFPCSLFQFFPFRIEQNLFFVYNINRNLDGEGSSDYRLRHLLIAD